MSSDDPSQTATHGEDLSSEQVMALTAVPILEYGRAWMMTPAVAERAAELELVRGFGFWVNGRAGVLGDVDADVAAAAIGFMAPDSVRELWGVRKAGTTPSEVAEAYADVAAGWGRETLSAIDPSDLVRLTELCDKIADAALPSCGTLFAGWRSLDRPGDPAGDATIALNVLRELRGGAHLSAVHAVGIGPHGAIMAADDPVRGGAAGAERFGWTSPHPPADETRRLEAERITTEICRPAFDALDQGERAEFVALVRRARAAVDG
ncbi:MAG: SCO6745 family protein [Acidimicrobiales bacterium]